MNELIERRNGRRRWAALADWEPLLFDGEGLRLGQWRAAGQLRVLKHGAHRTVYRVVLPNRSLFVKRYRRSRLADALGHLVRASAARREWHKAAEVTRRGIAAVHPVAWSEELAGGLVRDNYLVTEAVEPGLSLDRYVLEVLPGLPADTQQTARQRLMEGVARFIAAIHQAGIVHDDFHPGNVLLRLDSCDADGSAACDRFELCLVDLPGVRFSASLKWPAALRSLITWDAGWREQTSRGDRLRFLQAYLRARPDLDAPDWQTAVQLLERGSRDYSRRVARRRDKRSLRTNRDFAALRFPGREAHGVRSVPEIKDLSKNDFPFQEADSPIFAARESGQSPTCCWTTPELSRLLEDPDEPLEGNLHRPVKLGHSTVIVEAELPLADRPVHVAYKRYRPRNWWKALLGFFRRSRAVRGWCAGHALLLRGIATPRPLAVCDVRRPWHRRRGYLATEWIEGAENLHLHGWRLASLSSPDRLRRAARCAESLGRLIGRMHAWQISHRDLKAANLLVVENGAGLETYLIDVEDVRVLRRLSFSRQTADLARLAAGMHAHPWLPRTIFRRFLNAYLGEFLPESTAWKPLWREVARRSERIVERKQHRGEPVL